MKHTFTLLLFLLSSVFGVALLVNLHDHCKYNKCLRDQEAEKLEKWGMYFKQQFNQETK